MNTYEERAAGIREKAQTLRRARRARRRRMLAVGVPLAACAAVCLLWGGNAWLRVTTPSGEGTPPAASSPGTPADQTGDSTGDGHTGDGTTGGHTTGTVPGGSPDGTPEGSIPLAPEGELDGWRFLLSSADPLHIRVTVEGGVDTLYTDPVLMTEIRVCLASLTLAPAMTDADPDGGSRRTITLSYAEGTIVCRTVGDRYVRLDSSAWMVTDAAGTAALQALFETLERGEET